MKLEVTLTSDEYSALSKAPGRSSPQRMRWLVKFWQAVCEERQRQVDDPAKPPAVFTLPETADAKVDQ